MENSIEWANPQSGGEVLMLCFFCSDPAFLCCGAVGKVFLAPQMRQPSRFHCCHGTLKKSLLPSDAEASASKSLFSVNIPLKSAPPWHVTVAITTYISTLAMQCGKIHSHLPCQNSFIYLFIFYLVKSDSENKKGKKNTFPSLQIFFLLPASAASRSFVSTRRRIEGALGEKT